MSLLASDVMRRNLGIIDASASLADLERAFADAGVSGFPVVQHGRVVGVVSHTDVVRRLAAKEEPPRLSSFYVDLDTFSSEDTSEHLADLAARRGRSLDALRVSDVMTQSVVSVPPDAEICEVARTLTDHAVHRVLVIDADTLVGVVSSLDLTRLVAEGVLQPA